MRVIIRGNWSDCSGTDYCEALGHYPSLEAAWLDAEERAWETWEPQEQDEDGCEIEDEGPDFHVEEYIPGEDGHDNLRAGGGSFEHEF